jgi:hypothetical protein
MQRLLADKRLAEKAGWDREILAIELQALVSLDFEGPFAGSGTVMIAAERTGRRARALEIDCHYVDVAVRRWEDYTGKAAASGWLPAIVRRAHVETVLCHLPEQPKDWPWISSGSSLGPPQVSRHDL